MIPNPLTRLTLDDLRTRTSVKWRAYEPDVLPLWVAEMDVLLAEPVKRALVDAIHAGDTGYPVDGREYAEVLAVFARERWGWDGIDPARTSIVADVMVGVSEVLRLVTAPGDAVVVNCPVYPPFYSFVAHTGRRLVEAPLDADYRIDLAGLEQAFAEATRDGRGAAYLLCNPHNPTGTVHTREELAEVAALAAGHGVRVVVDEIHAPLVLPGATFTPYLAVPGGESGIAVYSASKGWNLAGIKAALAVAGPEAAADLARMPEIVSHGPSHLGVLAHVAALRDGGPWLDALLAGLDENRTLLEQLVREQLPDVRMPRPQATFLAWLDFSGVPGLPPEPQPEPGDYRALAGPAAYLVEHARVALSAGSAFGSGGAGHARLNFATSPQILTEAIGRIAASLPSVTGRHVG